MRLELEIAVARAAGRLSRLAGRGGGTTIPGKILASVDPRAVGLLAARLPLGSVLVSATNGKTTTSAIVAEILGGKVSLAHNRAGANLVSGVASALLARDGAELGLFEVDEGALPEIVRRVRPQAVCLGNLFRDQLDRYGELELIAARWRGALAELDPAAWAVVNADDPLLADIARGRPEVIRFGLDDPTVARERLQILLAHERTAGSGESDLVALLREEILAVIAKHLAVEQDNIQIKMDRGASVSTLGADIEIPMRVGVA